MGASKTGVPEPFLSYSRLGQADSRGVAVTAGAQENRIRVEMLGGFRVRAGLGEVLGEWPSRRSAELVQLLALADERTLARDQAIEALWSHLEPDQGAANLRKAAHHARQALGAPEAVVLRGGKVFLFPGGVVETDVAEFEARARAALASGAEAECAEAAAEYAGDLLPDARYEDWAERPRARLRALHADLLRAGGQWELLVEVDPTDEPAYRELMRRDLAAGSRPSAIQWFGRLRTALRDELGIVPSAETQAIYDECVAGLALDEPELVGRQLELAKATAFLRSEIAPKGAALLVRGPAGIGKSALCREVERIAREEGWLAVSVSATESDAPYAPVARAAEELLVGDPELLEKVGDRTRSVLAKISPLATPASPIDRSLTRHEVIGAVSTLFIEAARGAPSVLVVDDAHLADEATIDLLFHLGSAGRSGIAVGLAYRPERATDALRRGVARLVRAGGAVEIDLEPLEPSDAAALVAAGTATPRAPDVVERIVELTGGHPFLTLELARSPVAGVSALIASARDAVVARLVDLEEDETAMLSRLALAGDTLDPAGAAALAGAPEPKAFELLDAALSDGVLVVSGERYRFRHEMVRQALVERVAPHKRPAIHREMAAALAEAGADPGAVARQWLEGRRPREAREWLLAAARDAVKLGAFADALVHLDRLLEDERDHVEALRMRAEALDARGDRRAPAAYATAAIAVGPPEADDLKAKQALATIKLGDPEGAKEVLPGLEPTTLEGRIAEALAHCGCAVLGYATPEIGAAKAAEARRLAMEAGDTDALVIASWAAAAAAHAAGHLQEAVRTNLEETHAMPKLATSVFDGQLCMTERFLYGARPYDEVIAFADSLLAEAERLGAVRGRAFAVTTRGEAKLLSGRLDEAEKDLEEGVRLHRGIAAATGEAFAMQRLAEVHLYRGDRERAGELLDEALAIARESDVGFHLFDRIYGTRIAAAEDPADALAMLEEAEEAVRGPIETCPGCRINLAVPAAIAAARSGDAERAEEWERQSEWLANVVMRLPAWYAAMDEVRGHRALDGGDEVAAAEHFRAAAAGFASAGHALDRARCEELAGAVAA
jgi:DNA-binding SARP family transcriptional activator/tetratricopeptide (TPR) repeat protein